MKTKENPLTGQGSGVKYNKQSQGNSLPAQRQCLLNYRGVYGSLTTIEVRRFLDIIHPALRVMELKWQGNRINDVIEVKKSHRVELPASPEAVANGAA